MSGFYTGEPTTWRRRGAAGGPTGRPRFGVLPQNGADLGRFYGKARGHGFVPYATIRDLGRLIVNGGYAPD